MPNATPAKASPKLNVDPKVPDIDTDDDIERLLDLPEDIQTQANGDVPKLYAGLPKFITLKGIAAPIDRSNVNTDAIIPKQSLKTTKRTGLGSALFYTLRFNDDYSEKPGFVLNQEPFRRSKILVVTGPNIGCGSSQEHAPCVLLDFDIKCIIGPSDADIFFNSTFKNGMLPLAIPDQPTLLKIAKEAKAWRELEVGLVNQWINDASGNELAKVKVEELRKYCLVNGLDDIGLTMEMEGKIKNFESKRAMDTTCLDGSIYLKRGKRDGPVMVEAAPVPKTNRGEQIDEPLE